MIALFGLGRWDIPDGLEQAPVVEPVDPFESGVFNGFKGFPWSSPVDEFGLVETVDGFGQGVVVAVPDTADRRFDAGQAEPLRSEEHTSELQSQSNLVCRLLLEKKK